MISIVICSVNPTKTSSITRHLTSVLPPDSFELLVINDARSTCDGYNRGIARSRGDVFLFMHDDIEILTKHFVQRLRGHLQTYDVVGVAGTNRLMHGGNWISAGPPYIFGQVAHPRPPGFCVTIYGAPARAVGGIQAVDGVFIACKREVVEAVPFDEVVFDGFHGFDLDFTFGAYKAGFQLAVCNDLPILHASTGSFDERFFKYLALFAAKHPGELPPFLRRPFQFAEVTVQTKAEILEVMGCEAEQWA